MSSSPVTKLDRYTRIANLGIVVHNLLKRGLVAFAAVLLVVTALLYFGDNPGWLGFALMAGGTLFALFVWRQKGTGLPLVPTLAFQHLVAYGIPIIHKHATLIGYPPEYLTQAGWEVGIMLAALALGWRMGMELFFPGSARAYALKMFDTDGEQSRLRVAVGLVLATTIYQVLVSQNLVDFIFALLPAGTYSLVSAVLNAATLAGYFLLAMLVGAHCGGAKVRMFFWCSLVVNLILLSSSFLLSASTILVVAVIIGLFWSSGRIPWVFLCGIIGALAFLHLGKFEMRDRYWQTEDSDAIPVASLADLPPRYAEWIDASYRNLIGDKEPASSSEPAKKESASLLDRIDNLQNLLFAINAVDAQRIPVLGGATYSMIPSLLVPRILWPDKPRSHEGQVLLNVHFGRQLLTSTFTTYIAWGLLPEAYGNFGAIWGAVLLGGVLGLVFAWLENVTLNKPLLSLEGLVTFAFFANLAMSFEMVSSVLVTSLSQTAVVIVLACLPFVRETVVAQPPEAGA